MKRKKFPVNVKELICINDCYCPSEWEGLTDCNERIYIRYRWEKLRIEIGNKQVYCESLPMFQNENLLNETKNYLNFKYINGRCSSTVEH